MLPPDDPNERIVPSDEILRRYALGERDFRSLQIEDPEGTHPLRGQTLDGADFRGSFIVADFDDASLRAARLDHANLKTCSFARADLTDADFSGSALCATTFFAASMARTSFEGAYFHSHVLRRGELPDW
jgi:uncharacterized protein YjbI with pentapeptide repeats